MQRLLYAIYRGVAKIIRTAPLAAGFRLGRVLGICAYYLVWPYRRLVLHNLEIAFADETDQRRRRVLARKHFATLGANLFACIKLPTLSREELQSVVSVDGLEKTRALATQRGIVFAVNHIGNWELFAQLMPIWFARTGTIYQRLGNPHIDAEMRRDRGRLGLQLFERKEGFVAAAKFVREGGVCGVLVDQHAGDAGVWCPFFRRLASTSTLAATLAARTRAPIIPAAIYTTGVARWRLVFLPPVEAAGEDVSATTVRINEALESLIRRHPEEWFWVHNRWKTPRPKFLLATYKRGIAPASKDANRSLQPFSILVRAPNWLGDAVMSAAAVRAIKHGRPDARLSILTPAKLRDFWRSVPEVDDVITFEKNETIFATAKRLRARRFEAAILFPNSFRAALEAWLARIPRRVGYPGHHRAALLNQVLREKRKVSRPRHQVHRYLGLAAFAGAEIRPGDVLPMAVATAPHNDELVLGICPGAEYGPAKRWLPERFAEVISSMTHRHACKWKFFGVAKDRQTADTILRIAGSNDCSDLVGHTTLAELIDELRTCRLLLTNDTGTMHLAAHLGLPTVAIFGSTEPALTRPLGTGHRVIRHHVECSPCFLRECPIDFRCMRAVETSEVVAAIEELLEDASRLPPA